MRVNTSWAFAIITVLLLGATGCQKSVVNYSNTVQLEPGDEQWLTIDAPKQEQKVNVTIKSQGAPVNVYVLLEKDQQAVRKEVQSGKPSDKVLSFKEKVEEQTLEATIPAGNKFIVMLTTASTKSATVDVKIKGK